jgi:hypothetical protein
LIHQSRRAGLSHTPNFGVCGVRYECKGETRSKRKNALFVPNIRLSFSLARGFVLCVCRVN